ncbi:hypothetical protein [Companilactobacillus kimchiensis]|uniref:Uncharacterized protein n=1 Tax=Companilactobacillus kimchiensis TaxID=993692 RepID=A0A0R2L9W8_9LACO|nr:hypothetical protein [Companilactobacillus kimchiensis]KRN98320.1 hypothetical protein IV57_GL001237 [Companilactobacillus kimchiensis]
MNDEKKLLEYMSNFYSIPAKKLTETYTIDQLKDAYIEIEHKTKYQKHLNDKKDFPSEYLMREFSPL